MNSKYSNFGDLQQDAQMTRMVNDDSVRGLAMMRVCDHIYYNKGSVSYKNECDTVANTRFSQAFTSLNLGGSSILQIANMSIVDMIIMRLQIANIPADVSLPRGWGYSFINRIDYRIGSSITLTVNGPQHLQSVMAKTESVPKRDQVLRLGGDSVVAATALAEANVMLDVPISKLAMLCKKLPFDSKMLNLPVQIIVYFNTAAQVFGGTGVLPQSFSLGEFILRQLDFKDVEHSISSDLRLNPMGQYVHPFTYQQHQQAPVTLATAVPGTSVNLTGFRYGNLNAIGLCVVPDTSLNPTAPTTEAKNPSNFLRLENISLTFNGQIIYRCNGRSHDLIQMNNNLDSNFFQNNFITGNTTATFAQTAINSYFYYIDLSQYSCLREEGAIQSGIEVGSNVLQLSFTAPGNNGVAAQLFISYLYSAGIKVSSGGNQVDFVF